MVPTAEITVDTTSPHRRWKPPLADTCAICVALVICLSLGLFAKLCVVGVVVFIGFGCCLCVVCWFGVVLYRLFIRFVYRVTRNS